MSLSRRYVGNLLALVFAVGLLLPQALYANAILAIDTLTIKTRSGAHAFEVEIARTDEEQARGLMGRRYLPSSRGMIFDYPVVQPVTMWMENTFISLDMLFVDANGVIMRIAENTEPMSRRFIPSGGPARAVIELNAGTAARIGAKVGDTIDISFISKKS